MTTPHDSENRLRIDKTISIGSILSILIFLGGLIGAWGVFDKRIYSLEESRVEQRNRDILQDSISRERTLEVREAIKDLSASIIRLTDKMVMK